MHILVIAIGPVQEFIESARKCRDLWFGSWLLSELARAAAEGVLTSPEKEGEPQPPPNVLIFPGADIGEKSRAVANKIVARIHEEPLVVAQRAEQRMRQRLIEIRDKAFAKVAPRRADRLDLFLEKKARDQVDGLIEFLWAATEENEPMIYPKALEEAERILAAVKNSKRWEQTTWAEDGVPKSSLDGIRESVLHESLYDNPKNQSAKKGMSDGRRRHEFGVHRAERLCGVGVLKRFGSSDKHDKKNPEPREHPERILSTSHVASGPFRAGLAKMREGRTLWENYRSDLDSISARISTLDGTSKSITEELETLPRTDPTTGKIDGSVFYEGRLVETIEELGYNERKDDERKIFQEARDGLRHFLRKTRALGEPIPYYALLLADGDRMGKVIGEIQEFPEHRRLSETLEGFASSTRDTVKRHEGALVYAGGDDVLALLPLHTLLGCARELADSFASTMSEWKVTERQGDKEVERSPTLSVGIAVVHHLLPLDEALELVRQTEKVAKKVDGKNALAITVKKRGGEPVQVSGSWDQLDVRLASLIELHLRDAVSVKTQYELMDLAFRTDNAGPFKESMSKVREVEARRILARKQSSGGAHKISGMTFETLERLGAFSDPARLGRELYVAHLLSRAIEQANPQEKSNEAHQEAHS